MGNRRLSLFEKFLSKTWLILLIRGKTYRNLTGSVFLAREYSNGWFLVTDSSRIRVTCTSMCGHSRSLQTQSLTNFLWMYGHRLSLDIVVHLAQQSSNVMRFMVEIHSSLLNSMWLSQEKSNGLGTISNKNSNSYDNREVKSVFAVAIAYLWKGGR